MPNRPSTKPAAVAASKRRGETNSALIEHFDSQAILRENMSMDDEQAAEDLSRHIWESGSEDDGIRARLHAHALRWLTEASTLQLQRMAQAIDMIRADAGVHTPAESFIDSALSTHYFFGGLTPEWVAKQIDPENIEGFHRNYHDAVAVNRRFSSMYRPRIEPQIRRAS